MRYHGAKLLLKSDGTSIFLQKKKQGNNFLCSKGETPPKITKNLANVPKKTGKESLKLSAIVRRNYLSKLYYLSEINRGTILRAIEGITYLSKVMENLIIICK